MGIIAQQIAPLPASFFQSVNGGNLGAIGSPYKYQAGLGISMPPPTTNNSIQFNNKNSQPVLIITHDGDVEWHGKPSEAAEALTRTFQFKVEDMKGVTKAARRRYYWKAVDNLAKKSEKMSAEEFVDFVRKQAYTRECRVLIDTLKGEDL